MKKEIRNGMRAAAACALILVFTLALLAMPLESLPLWKWAALLALSKGVAVCCLLAARALLLRREEGGAS